MGSIRDMYQQASRDVTAATRNYWLNVAFLAGHQWLFLSGDDPDTAELHELPDTDRVQMVDNRMAANHRTIMGNATQRRLEFGVRPSGPSDAAQNAAAVATEVCYFINKRQHWETLREDVTAGMLKGGTAALCLDWDPATEETKSTALTISEFVIEPGARRAEEARWWIKAQLLPPEEVQATYKMNYAPTGNATAGMTPMSTKLLGYHMGAKSTNRLALVLSYYERPNNSNPQGSMRVEVNDVMVHNGPWMFPFKNRLNISVGQETRMEGRWFGDTAYNSARSPQVALNYVQSNLSEHLRNTSVARMAVPHSALHLMNTFDDVPGNMFPYADGQALPSWLQPPQLPAWLERLLDNYRASIDDSMGVHDVSRGRAPANLESGTAISILSEMDGSPVGRLIKEVARMFGDHASLSLMVYEAEGGSKKRAGTIEMDLGPIAFEWKGSDIEGQHDVFVPEDSIIPRSPAAQLQMAIKMMEMGLITTMEDFVRFSEAPGMREILDIVHPAIAKARRNHTLLSQGVPVVPATFDDFGVLIMEGNKFRMSSLYDRMKEEDQTVVDLYIKACESLAMEQASKQVNRSNESAALGAVPSADGAPPQEAEMLEEGAPPPPQAEPSPQEMMAEFQGLL